MNSNYFATFQQHSRYVCSDIYIIVYRVDAILIEELERSKVINRSNHRPSGLHDDCKASANGPHDVQDCCTKNAGTCRAMSHICLK